VKFLGKYGNLKVNMVSFNLLSLLEASFLVFNIEINILLILIAF
jgi:hypothetical protein